MAEFAILVEEKLHVKRKNLAKYCPNFFDSDEFENSDDEYEHCKKKAKTKLTQ